MKQKLIARIPNIKIIFFDAGNTLLRPYPSIGSIYAEIASRFGWEEDNIELEVRYHQAAHKMRQLTANGYDPPYGQTNEESYLWWEKLVCIVFPDWSHSEVFPDFFRTLYYELSKAKYFRLVPEAENTLLKLQKNGIRTGLISNWDVRLENILHEFKLNEILNPIVISANVGVEKPHPEIFLKALQMAGIESPDQAAYVGDSFEWDVEGAQNAGLLPFLIGQDDDVESDILTNHLKINTLSKLLDLFKID